MSFGDNQGPLRLYTTMRRIRSFEERVGELFVRGESAGSMLHLSIGEESVAGVCAAMTEGDTFTTHHRGHGIFIARGADPKRMMSEIAGKADGYCHGKGGSMHIADMGLGHLGANAIVGGGIPHIIGAGLAYRNRGEGRVSVAFFGDGAMQQGILYESMNMAALWKLPVVFCCINNQYGMGTRVDRSAGRLAFDERARAFGLDGVVVDGLDVEAVNAAAAGIVDGARNGRPGFISLEVFRFFGHARMDKSPYRSEEEEKAGRAKDPVLFTRGSLAARGIADAATLDGIDADVAAEMDAALEHAVKAAPPALDIMFDDVYGPGEPRPTPVRSRIADILSEARA
ncbi:thiamine pyrophosphate-dependent dehydrogenase E1 component subunit alpha [Chthonobacter albigriseus]|uniref:thiamine pyrophosphate-dependent dehydrogenase E1 component subunit alpha n=1 Tax=Chthonobacter albigriseus TaxID=1683161 RepID=UPI001FCE8062|nr:thiamine pyrophosphate-dependent dehydrogenase E1 component subunit alpha [Chthonobacter albigriseus]